MKISADYRMLALDALRGKWKTAVLTGIAASALGATIVSSSNSVVSNSNQQPLLSLLFLKLIACPYLQVIDFLLLP